MSYINDNTAPDQNVQALASGVSNRVCGGHLRGHFENVKKMRKKPLRGG